MKTLNLTEAAQLLHIHPQTLLEKARSGIIPAAKPGKKWVFIKEDLINWLRKQYRSPWQDVGQGDFKKCSTNEKIVNIGGLNSQTKKVEEYAALLKLPTERRHKS